MIHAKMKPLTSASIRQNPYLINPRRILAES